MPPGGAKCGHSALALRAQCYQLLNPGGAGTVPHLGVEGRALVAHLAHVAQHQQARGGQLGQHGNGCLHGIGVGVVGVVHHRQRAALPGRASARLRPVTGVKACRPWAMAAKGTPAATAQAVAARALRTLCRPAMCKAVSQRAVRGGDAHLPMVALPHGVRRLHIAATPAPKVSTVRPAAKPCHSGVKASSAGNTAVPSARQAWPARCRFLRPRPARCA